MACPECDIDMIRVIRNNHYRFWRCPKCYCTLPVEDARQPDLVSKEHRLRWATAVRNKLAKKRPVRYREYIRSKKWRSKATSAKQEARYTCQICNSPVKLQAHHRTYQRLGYEMPQDITALCDDCHELFSKHGKLVK